jgi:hypothetical protein
MKQRGTERAVGISNRESPAEEARERRAHPPLDGGRPRPRGGSVDERVLAGSAQTDHKAGVRSLAQKTGRARYADRSMPAARKVAGASGREPGGASMRDRKGSSHPGKRPAAKAEGRRR